MSRIGKKPIVIPDKVTVSVKPGAVDVAGPLGKLTQVLPPHTAVKVDKGQALVELMGLNDEEGWA
jgi:large subunit ribosomal protein L6